jgi:hypothetical protein
MKNTKKPTVRFETITPTRAKRDLAVSQGANTNVRNLIWTSVSRLARAMKENQWERNGASIAYNAKGILVDGQHRMAACVQAGVPFESVVVRGVEDVIHQDTGSRRLANQLIGKKLDLKRSAMVTAVARMLIVETLTGSVIRTAGGDHQPNTEDLLNFVKAHRKQLDRSCFVGDKCRHFAIPAALAFVHYGASTVTKLPEEADQFFLGMAEGEVKPGSPAHITLKRMTKAKLTGGSWAMKRLDEVALLIKSWNAHMLGERPKQIVLRKNQDLPWKIEQFPTIVTPDELPLADLCGSALEIRLLEVRHPQGREPLPHHGHGGNRGHEARGG